VVALLLALNVIVAVVGRCILECPGDAVRSAQTAVEIQEHRSDLIILGTSTAECWAAYILQVCLGNLKEEVDVRQGVDNFVCWVGHRPAV